MSIELSRFDFLKIIGLGSAELAAAPLKRFSIPKAKELPFYVGTYTNGDSKGIYHCTMNAENGQIKQVGSTGNIPNPSFLSLDHGHNHLYAVSETTEFEGNPGGSVYAYRIDQKTLDLQYINRRPSHGAAPCYLTVSRDNRCVLVANYDSGNVAVFPIQNDSGLGKLSDLDQHHGSSVNPKRQAGPHAHCIILDASNRHAFSTDLGLDKILVYQFDNNAGTLKPAADPFVKVQPGVGPRHIKFSPDEKRLYLICEMGGVIIVFDYDPENAMLTQIQSISTLPAGYSSENTAAEIQISADGRFVYGSNRGHDSIVVYSVDAENGKLTLVQDQSTLGKNPRHFIIDPTGRFLLAANEHSDNIVVFAIDAKTGTIKPTGQTANIPAPVCLKFM